MLAHPSTQPGKEAAIRVPTDGFIEAKGVSVFYGAHEAIKSVSLQMPRNQSVAMIGPSGCGKSTFLRSINRLNDLIPGCRVAGELLIGGSNIYADGVDLVSLRRRVGLVFQKPNPFPKSIYDNVAFGPRLQGVKRRGVLDQVLFGKRSKTGSRQAHWVCRVDNSSACASPVPLPQSRRCF